jgi:hypothetical protein
MHYSYSGFGHVPFDADSIMAPTGVHPAWRKAQALVRQNVWPAAEAAWRVVLGPTCVSRPAKELAVANVGLAQTLFEQGRVREALVPMERAVSLYRRLAKQRPDVFRTAMCKGTQLLLSSAR